MNAQLPQFTKGLQWAAPAGYPAENIVKAAPIETALFAVMQAVCFGHTPFHKRILKFPDTMGFIGGDADIMNDGVFLPQFPHIGVHNPVLQPPGTPPCLWSGPTETPASTQRRIFSLWRILIEKGFKAVRRLQPDDGFAGVLLQLLQMLIHLRKLQPGIAEQDIVHRLSFFQQPQ